MIPSEKEKRIRSLLAQGLSNAAIARDVGVDPETVRVRRKSPKQKLEKLKKPRRCKICRGKVKIWPCLKCHPKVGDYSELERTRKWREACVPPKEILSSEALELFYIVNEIQELHKLQLIKHPLFHDLAHRAKDSLKRITIKTRRYNG